MRSVWFDLDCCNGGIVRGVNNSDNDEDGDENYEDTEEDLCDGFFLFFERLRFLNLEKTNTVLCLIT